jgi:hypothetical protein
MRPRFCVLAVALALSATLSPRFTNGRQGPELLRRGSDQYKSKAANKQSKIDRIASSLEPRAMTAVPVSVGGDQTSNQKEQKSSTEVQGWWNSQTAPQWVLVVLAGAAAVFSFLAFRATRRQAIAAESTLLLTFRPKIIVRNVVARGLETLNRQTSMNKMTSDLTGYYVVANIGGRPAIIKAVTEGAWVDKALPMERPDVNSPGRAMQIKLDPGESKVIDFHHIELNVEDAVDLINQEKAAYLIVRITYSDEAGIKRETSACRRFDRESKGFIRTDNPDYEYSD